MLMRKDCVNFKRRFHNAAKPQMTNDQMTKSLLENLRGRRISWQVILWGAFQMSWAILAKVQQNGSLRQNPHY